jgi:hypothetical protein
MAEKWEYIGEEGKGKHKLTIDPGDGAPVQVYYGKTREEITQNLIQAQASATRQIDKLQKAMPKPPAPANVPMRRVPKPLNDNERFQVANDMTDPAKVDKAVQRVVESVTGITVDEIRENSRQQEEERAVERATKAAIEWAESEPDWFNSEHNKQTLVRYMMSMGMNPQKTEDYRRAYRELVAAGLLQAAPEGIDDNEPEPPPRQERITPVPNGVNGKPRTTATGFRSSDISGAPPRSSARVKYTPEQIARMGKEEYKRLWQTDPQFAKDAENYRPTQEGNSRRTR